MNFSRKIIEYVSVKYNSFKNAISGFQWLEKSKWFFQKRIKVRIFYEKGAIIPTKATIGSACYDVSAYIPDNKKVILKPGEIRMVRTGLYFEIPKGYFISFRSRSGLVSKYGVVILNSPGTIDSDYRGEVQFILANFGKKKFEIKNGVRLGQLLLEKEVPFVWDLVSSKEELTKTLRNESGFGSTGI